MACEQRDIFGLEIVWNTIRCCPQIQQSPSLRLLNPVLVIAVAVKDDALVLPDDTADQIVQSSFKILCSLQCVGILTQ